jgi:L-asparaginase / beta-aspartyl-peptidase
MMLRSCRCRRWNFIGVMWGVLALSQTTGQAEEAPVRKVEWAIAIHGGAGGTTESMTPEEIATYESALKKALEVGRKILEDGGTSLDAVEQTIRVLEDDPLFNAGRGAVFNSEGTHELDASIMDGRDRTAGAVGGVRTIKNPIALARLVMTETPHVLLIGDGAEQFADEMQGRPQIERVQNGYFSTPRRREQWERARQRDRERGAPEKRKGTVGCVALDRAGNLAAGTSTGGTTNKKFGRVGDSPIIGAGTYADNGTCAVSCTGTGEYFIRNSVSFHVSALMKYKGLSLEDAVKHVIFEVLDEDVGGLIAVGRDGSISMQMNTPGMSRGAADSSGRFEVMLGK